MSELVYCAPCDLEDRLTAPTNDGSFRMGFTKQWLDITNVVVKAVGRKWDSDETRDGYRHLRWTFETVGDANAAAARLDAAGLANAWVSVLPA